MGSADLPTQRAIGDAYLPTQRTIGDADVPTERAMAMQAYQLKGL